MKLQIELFYRSKYFSKISVLKIELFLKLVPNSFGRSENRSENREINSEIQVIGMLQVYVSQPLSPRIRIFMICKFNTPFFFLSSFFG